MKKVDIRNEERAILIAYLAAKMNKAKAEKEEKAAKATAKALFDKLGKAYKSGEKSDYMALSMQVKGEVKHIVYRETTAKGSIDWQAYAMALGGTEAGAEEYRKPSDIRTSIGWATDKQEAEIAQG